MDNKRKDPGFWKRLAATSALLPAPAMPSTPPPAPSNPSPTIKT